MNLDAAIAADDSGFAIGYTSDGRIAAEATGAPHYLSKRKRRKAAKSAKVWIWSPPKRDTEAGRGYPGCQVRRQRLHKVAKDKRRMLDQLNWQPRRSRSVIDRLAQLTRGK